MLQRIFQSEELMVKYRSAIREVTNIDFGAGADKGNRDTPCYRRFQEKCFQYVLCGDCNYRLYFRAVGRTDYLYHFKIRIAKAWQRKGQVVSMTGDGVNDTPALKAADIGCAMGITGTDVAKGAADMTLTDDNFATIVDAVREGRGIYANIRKVVGFLLGTNIGEVITVFAAMLLWHKTPLLSMQLLWINLVTDSLPAIALGMEAVESDVMHRKPKPKDEGIFAHGLGLRVVLQGLMFALLTLIGFVVGENVTGTLAGGQTMAFMILSLSQIVQAYNMRSDHSLFKIRPFTNHKLNWAALAFILLVCLVLFTPVGIAFGLITLPWQLYLLGLGLILVPVLVMELSKACGLFKHQH